MNIACRNIKCSGAGACVNRFAPCLKFAGFRSGGPCLVAPTRGQQLKATA